MIDNEPVLIKILIIVATLCGFAVAVYIHNKKIKNEVMVCPIDSDCNAVIKSKYSKLFGFPVELLGIIYYASFFIIYLLTLFIFTFNNTIEIILIILSSLALGFSLYLLSLQAFIIREWCFWCLLSFTASTAIFTLFAIL